MTDAHLLLGRLSSDHFLGGTFALDVHAAERAFDKFIQEYCRPAARRGAPQTALQLAEGVVAVANATMERALRVISVERGHDPRDFVLVSFGGAGGLHAASLAAALGAKRVVVPRNPGVFSALGILLSDIVKDVSHSVLLPVPPGMENLSHGDGERFRVGLARRFEELERAGRQELRREGFAGGIAKAERSLDIRYAGQAYELSVPFAPDFARRFHRQHREAYGHAEPGRPLEIVSLRVRLIIETPKEENWKGRRVRVRLRQGVDRQPARRAVAARKPAWFDGGFRATPFYDRDRLAPSAGFNGPAVVVEYSSTTVVPPDWRCRLDELGSLVLLRRG